MKDRHHINTATGSGIADKRSGKEDKAVAAAEPEKRDSKACSSLAAGAAGPTERPAKTPAPLSTQFPVPWKPAEPLSQADDDGPSRDGDGVVATEEAKPELKLKKPPLYKVILINDDYTPMEFVVEVLETFFKMNREQATQVMLAVHTQGKGVCGIYTRDIAETKAAQVNQFARDHQHPLLCEIEASED